MDNAEYARDCLKRGFSCSRAVLSAFMEQFDIDRDTALRISSAFGGGMGGMGGVCGAVAGAFMVMGLKYGSTGQHDDKERTRINRKAVEYMSRFQSLKGSILCSDLLGADVGTAEGLETAKTKGLFDNICPDIIRCSVEILEGIRSDKIDVKY
jgi:C_GCAxxG_C_C family probable redox protein